MSANFVAREVCYHMTGGWMDGDDATNTWFRPERTFVERFDSMLGEIASLGFDAIDLWLAHLSPAWATDRQVREAKDLLSRRGLRVCSLAAYLPDDMAVIRRICELAVALNAPVLGGGCPPALLDDRRPELLHMLDEFDLRLGYENHPEKDPAELLRRIGEDPSGRIGVTIDTGWFGSQGYDAAKAVRELLPRILHVHLKDIRTPEKGWGPTLKDMGHETCALGDGVVPVEECVRELMTGGYSGTISIEHEPEDRDPSPDVALSLDRLQAWLGR